jgi:1-acyl-sn-glycerol-3-phosphate acyltransferase
VSQPLAAAGGGTGRTGGGTVRTGTSGWFLLGIALLKPATLALTRRESTGLEHVPAGGVVLAANHISLADPVVLCDFVLADLRRAPRFLAKAELFRGSGLVARVMRGAGQIPVDRGSTRQRAPCRPRSRRSRPARRSSSTPRAP